MILQQICYCYLFQISNFDTFEVFKKFQLFFQKRQLFSLKEQRFWKFWAFSIFQSHSTAKLLILAIFKISCFFRETIFLNRRTKFLNTLRNLTISVPFYSKFAIISNFEETLDFFFEKPIVFKQKPNFERFEKSDYSRSIIQQISYLQMLKSFQVLFRKTIVFVRKHKFWTI